MTLEKIDRRDGSVAGRFEEGTPEFNDEYRTIRNIYSSERGIAADNDFREVLRRGLFATAGCVYKLK